MEPTINWPFGVICSVVSDIKIIFRNKVGTFFEVTLDIDVAAGVSSNNPILDPSSDSVTTQMVRHSQSKVS